MPRKNKSSPPLRPPNALTSWPPCKWGEHRLFTAAGTYRCEKPRSGRGSHHVWAHLLQFVPAIELRLVQSKRLAAMRFVLLRLGTGLRRGSGRCRSLSECDRNEHRCNESNCEFLHVILQAETKGRGRSKAPLRGGTDCTTYCLTGAISELETGECAAAANSHGPRDSERVRGNTATSEMAHSCQETRSALVRPTRQVCNQQQRIRA